MEFTERLKHFLTERLMSREELSAILGVRPVTVLRWENGTSKPQSEIAKKLSKLGFGEITDADTKNITIPRSVVNSSSYRELRKAVRQNIIIANEEVGFEPSPYVINGPADQLSLFESFYELQDAPRRPISPQILTRRLSAVSIVPTFGIQTAQYELEKPKENAKHWNSNYGPHGWHRYVGRFPPHLVRTILNHFGLSSGDVVCDPFVGSGTTLVEARLLGVSGIGLDICPLSCMVSRAKAHFPADPSSLEERLAEISDRFDSKWVGFLKGRDPDDVEHVKILERTGNKIPTFRNVKKWFCPSALLGVSIAVEILPSLTGYERDFFACALSSKMRSIGNVDVDVVRAEYSKKPRSNVNVLELWVKQSKKMISSIKRTVASHRDLIGPPGDQIVIDRSILSENLEPQSIDSIITSPPYGVEALSYLRTHLLSYRVLYPLLGHDPYTTHAEFVGSEYLEEMHEKVGEWSIAGISATFDDTFHPNNSEIWEGKYRARALLMAQFFEQMSAIAGRFDTWLKPGGSVAFVVGNKKIGQFVVPTTQIVRELFQASNLHFIDALTHKLKCGNTNSEVPWQERIIQEEAVLLFEKK